LQRSGPTICPAGSGVDPNEITYVQVLPRFISEPAPSPEVEMFSKDIRLSELAGWDPTIAA